MRNIGIFVDVSNLYYTLKKRYDFKKLNYSKYIDYIVGFGEIKRATAYGAEIGDQAKKFTARLREIGFETRYKEPKTIMEVDGFIKRKADWDIGITLDIVSNIPTINTIFLGSADGDFAPLIKWCKNQGKDVFVLACNISYELQEVATKCFEIPENWMEINYKEETDE